MKLILSLAAVLTTMTATAAPAIAADRDHYSNYAHDGLYYESYEDLADYREDSSDYFYYSFPYYNFYSPFYGYSTYPYYNFRD